MQPRCETGPAHLVLLDDGDRQTGRGAVEGGGVAGRTATDHDDIELGTCRRRHHLLWASYPRRCFRDPRVSLPGAHRRRGPPSDRLDPRSGPPSDLSDAGRRSDVQSSGGSGSGRRPAKPSSGRCHQPRSSSPSCQQSWTTARSGGGRGSRPAPGPGRAALCPRPRSRPGPARDRGRAARRRPSPRCAPWRARSCRRLGRSRSADRRSNERRRRSRGR